MNAEQLIAFDLIRRLHDLVGPVVVTQVDLVACEDGGASTMAYIYDVDDACVPLVFDTPPNFDAVALQAALESNVGTRH